MRRPSNLALGSLCHCLSQGGARSGWRARDEPGIVAAAELGLHADVVGADGLGLLQVIVASQQMTIVSSGLRSAGS